MCTISNSASFCSVQSHTAERSQAATRVSAAFLSVTLLPFDVLKCYAPETQDVMTQLQVFTGTPFSEQRAFTYAVETRTLHVTENTQVEAASAINDPKLF